MSGNVTNYYEKQVLDKRESRVGKKSCELIGLCGKENFLDLWLCAGHISCCLYAQTEHHRGRRTEQHLQGIRCV